LFCVPENASGSQDECDDEAAEDLATINNCFVSELQLCYSGKYHEDEIFAFMGYYTV
jgi:hypothetical protein